MFPIKFPHAASGHCGPMISGHEFAGVVLDTGRAVNGFSPSNPVVSGAGISCGKCIQCIRGRTNLCDNYSTIGINRNAALAEVISVLPEICMNVEGMVLTPDLAALSQPMAVAVHAMRGGRVAANDEAVLVGAGGVGAFLTFALDNTVERVAVFDINQESLDIVLALGADHVGLVGDIDMSKAIQEWATNPTVIYEVPGSVLGLELVRNLASKGTRIVLVGLQDTPMNFNPAEFTLHEEEFLGTSALVCGTDLPEAVQRLASREGSWDDVAPIVLSLDDLVELGLKALSMGHSQQIKVLIDPRAYDSRKSNMSIRQWGDVVK